MTEQTRLALPSGNDFFLWLHMRDVEKPDRMLIVRLLPLRYKNDALQRIIAEILERNRKQLIRFEKKEAWNGFGKKYYFEEYKRFNIEKEIKIEDHTAELITHKLARHFKFTLRGVRFYGNGGGHASYWSSEIRLPHNPSVVMITHELAHLHNHEKYGNGKHNKRLAQTVKRFIAYGHRMKYWQQEPTT